MWCARQISNKSKEFGIDPVLIPATYITRSSVPSGDRGRVMCVGAGQGDLADDLTTSRIMGPHKPRPTVRAYGRLLGNQLVTTMGKHRTS